MKMSFCSLFRQKNKPQEKFLKVLAGMAGLEPTKCHSQSVVPYQLGYIPMFWGGRWDLNPRQPEPQSGALPTELHPPSKQY